MLMGRIENSNLLLQGDGDRVVDIHARLDQEGGYQSVTTAWFPTPDELRRLNLGHPVYVTMLIVSGVPPVRVGVKP